MWGARAFNLTYFMIALTVANLMNQLSRENRYCEG